LKSVEIITIEENIELVLLNTDMRVLWMDGSTYNDAKSGSWNDTCLNELFLQCHLNLHWLRHLFSTQRKGSWQLQYYLFFLENFCNTDFHVLWYFVWEWVLLQVAHWTLCIVNKLRNWPFFKFLNDKIS